MASKTAARQVAAPAPARARKPRSAVSATPSVNHRTVVGQRRRAGTRASIIQAALQVYARMGPDAPVVDDFVEAVGMSRGTFYYHFSTTDELLMATIEWLRDNLACAVTESVGEFTDAVDRTAIAMRAHLEWATSDPRICAFFARVPQVTELGRREASATLREGVASGDFNVSNVNAACDLIVGSLAETVRQAALRPITAQRSSEVVTLVLAGLGVPHERIRQVMALPLPRRSGAALLSGEGAASSATGSHCARPSSRVD